MKEERFGRYGWCDFCQMMREDIGDCCECMASLCASAFCQGEHDSFCAGMAMSNARCRMLAHPTDERTTYRCPSTPYRFHYHAVKQTGPLVLATMRRICEHRHKEASAASKCFEKGG